MAEPLKPQISQYFTDLRERCLEERVRRATSFCYDTMLETARFVAGALLSNGIQSVKGYIPFMQQAVAYLRFFHNDVMSPIGSAIPVLRRRALKEFANSLVELGIEMKYAEYVTDGVGGGTVSVEKIQAAGLSLQLLGSGLARFIDEGYLFVDGLTTTAVSHKQSLEFSETIANKLVAEALCTASVKGYDSASGLQQLGALVRR